MINRGASVIFITLTSLTGCATQAVSSVSRIEPIQPQFTYEKTIDRPQGDVWDLLVKNMAKSFFVINNIDKESRIINLSYSSDRPQDYVDCGRTIRTYSDGKNTETFEHGVTDNLVTFKAAPDSQPDPRFTRTIIMVRNAKLDGRANVYVAPEGKGTLVSVNAKSVVRITSNGEVVAKNFAGNVIAKQALPSSLVEVTGVTKGGTENTVISGGTTSQTLTCYSTGKLESDILDLAN